MHFSCDLCSKNLREGVDGRYVVKMEIFAAHDPAELTEDDLDADHLEEMSLLLADEDASMEPSPVQSQKRFDLCPTCHKKFLADPLGREALKFSFSPN